MEFDQLDKDYSKYYKINAVILRPTIVVGNLTGEENALNEFTRNAFNDEPIVIYGDGKHKREYISISDLVTLSVMIKLYKTNLITKEESLRHNLPDQTCDENRIISFID